MNENGAAEYTYSCPRCGNEVSSKSRYCMKCGNLNPDHPDNKQYAKMINKNGMSGYTVGENGISVPVQDVNTNVINARGVDISFGSRMGSFTLCFVLNFLIHILLIGGVTYAFYQLSSGDIPTLFSSELCYLLLIISLVGIYNYSVQLTYMKMNSRWWVALIPLVNLYALSDAIYEKKLLNLLVFVPIVGEIYLLVLLYKMGKDFKVSGLLTMLFPFIMFPVIGFGSHAFRGVCYVSGRDSLEKEYRKKRSFFVLSIFVIICSVVMFIYSHTVTINKGMDKLSSYYLYYASQRVITRTKLKVESNNYECNLYSNTLYFYYADLEDYFSIPFYVFRDPIEAYVKVVITPGGLEGFDKYDYYLSMTDGTYGFEEIAVDDITLETIKEYPSLDLVYKSGSQCHFRRSA